MRDPESDRMTIVVDVLGAFLTIDILSDRMRDRQKDRSEKGRSYLLPARIRKNEKTSKKQAEQNDLSCCRIRQKPERLLRSYQHIRL